MYIALATVCNSMSHIVTSYYFVTFF